MFPITDQSETIINCLLKEAKSSGVEILLEHGIQSILRKAPAGFLLELTNGKQMECESLLMATGSTSKIYPLLEITGPPYCSPCPFPFYL